MHETGIYKITNQINQKVYIGQAQDIQRRWRNHRRDAKNCTDPKNLKNPLYQDIRKYGINNFIFEIIEICSLEELNDKERYWISYYDSFHNGYNRTEGGQNAAHPNKMTDALFESIIYDLKNTLLSTEDIGKKNNISGRMVRDINNGVSWKKDYLTYPIRKSLIVLKQEENKKLKKKKQKKNPDFIAKQKVQIIERDRLHGLELAKLIVENNFTYVGKYYNVSPTTIRRWCKKDDIPSTIKELTKWYYDTTGLKNPKEKPIPKNKAKTVMQIDPNTNEIVNIYSSTREAERKIKGNSNGRVSTACNTGGKAFGYYWRYKDSNIK